jgi:hypothetical protein
MDDRRLEYWKQFHNVLRHSKKHETYLLCRAQLSEGDDRCFLKKNEAGKDHAERLAINKLRNLILG